MRPKPGRSRAGPVWPNAEIRTITSPRFTAESSAHPSPHRSIVPGRKFSASTSADAASRFSSACPSGTRRLQVIDFLLRDSTSHQSGWPAAARRPSRRRSSPVPGCSTLTTVAPNSARSVQQNGAATKVAQSRMVRPSSACTLGRLRRVDPRLPLVGREADGHLAAVADERRAQQAGLRQGALEQSLRRVPRHPQPQGPVAGSLLVDEGAGAEALGEAAQLALRGRALLQVDVVHRDPPLGEEALRLARVLAVVEAEDLDGHAGGSAGLDARARRTAPSSSSYTLIGTGGWPSGLARPERSP